MDGQVWGFRDRRLGRRRVGFGSVALVALLGLVLAPAAAHGASASRSGSQLTYTAGPGEVNHVRVSLGSTYTISDSGAGITPGSGCTAVDAQTVNCSASGVTSLDVNVGDGDDGVRNRTTTPSVISGGDGDDALLGGDGPTADRVNGDGGNDAIDGGVGADIISGGSGDDTITSRGTHVDTISCGSGLDSVIADRIDETAGDCEFVARPGGSGQSPTLDPDLALLPPSGPNACATNTLGTPGNDSITGTPAGDNIYGLGGRDRLDGVGGDDCLFGGSGGDRVIGSDGHDRLQGDAGRDNLRGSRGRDGLLGGRGNDKAYGDRGDDGLLGGIGNDRLWGGIGNDGISGGSGNDRLLGGSGRDRLFGRSGNDIIRGGGGRNRMYGEDGNDRIVAANGKRDRVNCGAGQDVARVDAIDKIRRCERVITVGR